MKLVVQGLAIIVFVMSTSTACPPPDGFVASQKSWIDEKGVAHYQICTSKGGHGPKCGEVSPPVFHACHFNDWFDGTRCKKNPPKEQG